MCIKHDSSTHYQININTHPTEFGFDKEDPVTF